MSFPMDDSILLPLNNKQGEIPKRIQLLPPGPYIKGRDGREWILLNSKETAAASNKWLPNHPIDENHATDIKAPRGESSPAFGWFSNVTAEPDGSIWADAEWTEKGKAAVAGLEYRYISPVLQHNTAGEITVILRAALSNSPNLDIKSLNSEAPEEHEKLDTADLIKILGLPETATEAEAEAAFAVLKAAINK